MGWDLTWRLIKINPNSKKDVKKRNRWVMAITKKSLKKSPKMKKTLFHIEGVHCVPRRND